MNIIIHAREVQEGDYVTIGDHQITVKDVTRNLQQVTIQGQDGGNPGAYDTFVLTLAESKWITVNRYDPHYG